MTRPRTLDTSAPVAARLLDTLRYPLRGAALAALTALALGLMLADLLPSILGTIAWVMAWVGIYIYALACLRASADGWADPPEITLHADTAAAALLFFLQLLSLYATKIAYNLWQDAFVLPLGLALVLPALTLSLGFGDSLWSALNPLRLMGGAAALGAAYLLPVATGLLQFLAWIGALQPGHGLAASAFWLLLTVYCVLLNFHLLGRLAYRFHERLGHQPEADEVGRMRGQGRDEQLLARVRSLDAAGHGEQAIELLHERLRDRHAPYPVHAAYRRLLRAAGRQQALIDSSPWCLACLAQSGDWQRALAVIGENVEIDPDYLPGDPALVAELADRAAGMGMNRLALKLARGYVNTWPREPAAPRYGLMAAHLLGERLDQPAEAGVLASKLLVAFPDTAERPRIEALLARLGQDARRKPA